MGKTIQNLVQNLSMNKTTEPPCPPGHHFGRCFSVSQILHGVLTLMLLLPSTTAQELRPPGPYCRAWGTCCHQPALEPVLPQPAAAGTQPAVGASLGLTSPWRGTPSCDGSFTRSVSMPRLLPHPTGAFRSSHPAPTTAPCQATRTMLGHISVPTRFLACSLSTSAAGMKEGPTRRLSPLKESPPSAVLGCSAVRGGGPAGRAQVPGIWGPPGPQSLPPARPSLRPAGGHERR